MANLCRLSANRRNAAHSTGPRTAEGKKATSGNAVRHGLKVQRERLEDAERALARGRWLHALVSRLVLAEDGEWVQPDDALFLLEEAATVQGDEVREPVTYEAVAAGTVNLDGVVADVRGAEFLAMLGVPDEFYEEPERWDGWTAGLVRTGMTWLASRDGKQLSQALRELTAGDFAFLERRVTEARAAVERLEVVERGRTAVPPDAALAVVRRDEPQLSRQVSAVLDQLEKVRALRRG